MNGPSSKAQQRERFKQIYQFVQGFEDMNKQERGQETPQYWHLLIGGSGVGKSTFANFVRLDPRNVAYTRGALDRVDFIDTPENFDLATIGHEHHGETIYPRVYKEVRTNSGIIDCGGLWDSRGDQYKVGINLCTEKILEDVPNLQNIFCFISYADLKSRRAENFKDFVRILGRMLPNPEPYKSRLTFVITGLDDMYYKLYVALLSEGVRGANLDSEIRIRMYRDIAVILKSIQKSLTPSFISTKVSNLWGGAKSGFLHVIGRGDDIYEEDLQYDEFDEAEALCTEVDEDALARFLCEMVIQQVEKQAAILFTLFTPNMTRLAHKQSLEIIETRNNTYEVDDRLISTRDLNVGDVEGARLAFINELKQVGSEQRKDVDAYITTVEAIEQFKRMLQDLKASETALVDAYRQQSGESQQPQGQEDNAQPGQDENQVAVMNAGKKMIEDGIAKTERELATIIDKINRKLQKTQRLDTYDIENKVTTPVNEYKMFGCSLFSHAHTASIRYNPEHVRESGITFTAVDGSMQGVISKTRIANSKDKTAEQVFWSNSISYGKVRATVPYYRKYYDDNPTKIARLRDKLYGRRREDGTVIEIGLIERKEQLEKHLASLRKGLDVFNMSEKKDVFQEGRNRTSYEEHLDSIRQQKTECETSLEKLEKDKLRLSLELNKEISSLMLTYNLLILFKQRMDAFIKSYEEYNILTDRENAQHVKEQPAQQQVKEQVLELNGCGHKLTVIEYNNIFTNAEHGPYYCPCCLSQGVEPATLPGLSENDSKQYVYVDAEGENNVSIPGNSRATGERLDRLKALRKKIDEKVSSLETILAALLSAELNEQTAYELTDNIIACEVPSNTENDSLLERLKEPRDKPVRYVIVVGEDGLDCYTKKGVSRLCREGTDVDEYELALTEPNGKDITNVTLFHYKSLVPGQAIGRLNRDLLTSLIKVAKSDDVSVFVHYSNDIGLARMIAIALLLSRQDHNILGNLSSDDKELAYKEVLACIEGKGPIFVETAMQHEQALELAIKIQQELRPRPDAAPDADSDVEAAPQAAHAADHGMQAAYVADLDADLDADSDAEDEPAPQAANAAGQGIYAERQRRERRRRASDADRVPAAAPAENQDFAPDVPNDGARAQQGGYRSS